uniref:Uncharacterized protein n=1 Tax=Romanomermis culicivorax TaxID=13658 RepID=A0A915HVW3_ROMCU
MTCSSGLPAKLGRIHSQLFSVLIFVKGGSIVQWGCESIEHNCVPGWRAKLDESCNMSCILILDIQLVSEFCLDRTALGRVVAKGWQDSD